MTNLQKSQEPDPVPLSAADLGHSPKLDYKDFFAEMRAVSPFAIGRTSRPLNHA